MSAVRLAILGAGSLRYGLGIVGSLATYFGERPLEIRMYDADFERLDLFDRLLRLSSAGNFASHNLISTTDPAEALEDANAIVLAIEPHCAQKLLRGDSAPNDEALVELALERLLRDVSSDTSVLSLLDPTVAVPRETYHRVPWAGPVSEYDRVRIPMQILRWLNKEEMLYELFEAYDRSPIKAWLDDPRTAELVLGRT